MGDHLVTDKDDAQSLFGDPKSDVFDKSLPELDRHCKLFVELCPFLCIASSDAKGKADNSPRGDAPGFVRVIDAKTIVIPERIGNRRIDTVRNILENPEVALIMFVPGIEETVRINGRAEVLDPGSPALEGLDVKGKAPLAGIQVQIEEVFFHCARALKRSRLWDPDSQIPDDTFPSLGQVIRDQLKLKTSAEQLQAELDESYKTLY